MLQCNFDITTVEGAAAAAGLEVDTPFRVQGMSATGYNGQFVVSEKLSASSIKYQVQNTPCSFKSNIYWGNSYHLSSDTVTSASPYVFNVSLRSVFGMCGIHADGSIRQLDLDPWLLHNLLVLVFKKMIMHS